MATEIKIIKTKSGDTLNFIFETGEIKSLDRPTESNSASLSFPTDDPTEDNSFTIDLGISRELSFEFTLYRQTTDRSEGTHTSTVKTFSEIINYLEDSMLYTGVGEVTFQIAITSKFGTRTDIYSLKGYTINMDAGIYLKGNMSFVWKRKVV